MKKTVVFGFSILAACAAFPGCNKHESSVPPEPDIDTQTALDAAWMTYVVTDIDQMTAFIGVGEERSTFYAPVNTATVSPAGGDVEPYNDPSTTRLSMLFNRTHSRDGRFRTGEIRLRYDPALRLIPEANPNALYYHKYGFAGELTLSDYYIDRSADTAADLRGRQWLVTMPVAGLINNEMKQSAFNASNEKLTWRISAKFRFRHPTDASGNGDMSWEGTLYKVLENTSDPEVFDPSRNVAVTWSLAVCGYYGEITGKMGNRTYKLSIRENERLVRDFSCTPDRVNGVTISADGAIAPQHESHHPFVKGIAAFEMDNKYPRQVYFGNESNTRLSWQCDNTGEVLIKGIAYKVNFIK
jgi:hypothetical protein